MHSVFAASSNGSSSPADILVVVLGVVLILGVFYGVAVARRARSRRAHSHIEATGHGSWYGTISEDDLIWLFPDVTVGWGRSFMGFLLSNGGIPVALDLDPQGLRLRLSGRLMRHVAGHGWSAPWTAVAACTIDPIGFRTIGGKVSVIRLTDVLITVVGRHAEDFLESWGLDDEAAQDDPAPTADELAEDAEWLETVKRDLGPSWTPGTAQLRIRMSETDGLAEAISRWARGHKPGRSPHPA